MMRRAIATAGALMFCLASAMTLAGPPGTAKTPESIRDLVYWGAGRPIRVRLHLQIAGRAADAVWSEAVGALFAFCDRNGDGVLDAAEYAPFVEQRRGRERLVVPEVASGMPALRLTFENRNAKVTRAGFETALRDAGFGPVILTVTPAQPNSQRLSTALFRRLDRDGDGKLSTEELRDARERLAFFDANEDELISVAELLGRVETTAIRPVAIQRFNRADSTDSTSDLVLLPGDLEAAIKQILSTRRDGGDAFGALDKNGNGRLDTAELKAWLGQLPDLEVRVSVGSPNDQGQGLFRLLSEPNGGRLRVRTNVPGELEASSARVGFRFDQTAGGEHAAAARNGTIDLIRAEIKRLADKDGIVQRKQLELRPRRPDMFDLPAFFDFADRNADGKLDAAEVEAALKVLAPLFAGCRTTITVRDQGTGLFELLDRNGDSRLSPRELVDAVEVLKPFADSTGKVSPSDLPRRFFVQIAVEPIPVIDLAAPPPPAVQIQPREGVPAWFYDMDRNGDGDVSLREFLGPIELFRKLDKNGDGLISIDEARDARLDK